MKLAFGTAIAIASLALIACDKPQDAKPTEPATPAPNAPAATAANTGTGTTTGATQAKTAEPVTIADSDLVTPADFEATEETAITAKNYKTEIAALEAEMSKE